MFSTNFSNNSIYSSLLASYNNATDRSGIVRPVLVMNICKIGSKDCAWSNLWSRARSRCLCEGRHGTCHSMTICQSFFSFWFCHRLFEQIILSSWPFSSLISSLYHLHCTSVDLFLWLSLHNGTLPSLIWCK